MIWLTHENESGLPEGFTDLSAGIMSGASHIANENSKQSIVLWNCQEIKEVLQPGWSVIQP